MKTIEVKWIDAELRTHYFQMEVPENESKLNIDHLVMDQIFDEAIDHYSWSNEVNKDDFMG